MFTVTFENDDEERRTDKIQREHPTEVYIPKMKPKGVLNYKYIDFERYLQSVIYGHWAVEVKSSELILKTQSHFKKVCYSRSTEPDWIPS